MSFISLFRLLFKTRLQENLSYRVAGVHVLGSTAPSSGAVRVRGSASGKPLRLTSTVPTARK